MTLPQIIVDLLTLLFDMAVPAAICTMVLAGIAFMGENGPCLPNIVLPIKLDQPGKLDNQVRKALDYAGAMLGSLASATKIVEIVREIYDEYLRKHRLEPGLPFEPGTARVREQ